MYLLNPSGAADLPFDFGAGAEDEDEEVEDEVEDELAEDDSDLSPFSLLSLSSTFSSDALPSLSLSSLFSSDAASPSSTGAARTEALHRWHGRRLRRGARSSRHLQS